MHRAGDGADLLARTAWPALRDAMQAKGVEDIDGVEIERYHRQRESKLSLLEKEKEKLRWLNGDLESEQSQPTRP